MEDSKPNAYGKRKLGAKKWAEEEERRELKSRQATVYGNRKRGGKRPPGTATDVVTRDDQGNAGDPGSLNPFVRKGGDRVTIAQMAEALEADPGQLDVAIETELSHPDKPRKGAVDLLLKIENARREGAREAVVKLLTKYSSS